ncbi:uncharacterized protein LOC143186420 [Calliopsis andreniformis]|uniref:uncharacterized protein LOC143186420 n=1 Tax=Calliopsis andreniformis TaxID=337506 RepID=UPI003FCD3FA7
MILVCGRLLRQPMEWGLSGPDDASQRRWGLEKDNSGGTAPVSERMAITLYLAFPTPAFDNEPICRWEQCLVVTQSNAVDCVIDVSSLERNCRYASGYRGVGLLLFAFAPYRKARFVRIPMKAGIHERGDTL